MGEVIVIASGKDGVGKTVLTVNLGAVLAQNNHSVVLMDLNFGSRNLDIYLGLENRIVYDLVDVITGVCRIKQAMVRDRRFPNLFLISAPQSRHKASVSPEQLQALCHELKKVFDYIIIDAPAGIGSGLALAVSPADRAVVVTVPEYAAIRDTEIISDLLESKGIVNRSVVINKIIPELHQSGLVPDPEEIAETLRLPIAGLIAYDQNIHVSTNMGVPIAAAQGSYIARNLNEIGSRILSRNL
jgi:septum site-determining protein MinD